MARIYAGSILIFLATVILISGCNSESDSEDAPTQEETVSDAKLLKETQAQAAQHFQAGKELFCQFEYESAQRELVLAVKMDPANKEASDLLMRVKDVLNARGPRSSGITNQVNSQKISAQEKRVDLENRIDWGKKFMELAKTDASL